MSKSHAEHNEKLCDLLIKNKGFNDWVITTAFYSSMHYVHSKIFPVDIAGKTYKNLSIYCSTLAKGSSASKHITIISLVSIYINRVVPHYRWLYDTCMNARYHNYQISEKLANQARKYLDEIKAAC